MPVRTLEWMGLTPMAGGCAEVVAASSALPLSLFALVLLVSAVCCLFARPAVLLDMAGPGFELVLESSWATRFAGGILEGAIERRYEERPYVIQLALACWWRYSRRKTTLQCIQRTKQ